jgi:hypothetical protein
MSALGKLADVSDASFLLITREKKKGSREYKYIKEPCFTRPIRPTRDAGLSRGRVFVRRKGPDEL